MSNTRLLAALLALTCICGAAVAQVMPMQPAPAQPVMPPVEPVLTHMPAGTMGFVVVNGIDDLFTKIETFYNEIGAPAGPMPPLQQMMLSELGSDFNPNGGFAAAMLDPSLFGVDLGELLSEGMGGGHNEKEEYVVTEDGEVVEVEGDDEGLEESPPIPYVLFLPGLDPANVLPPDQFEVSQEGDYTVLTNSWSEEKLYAVQAGGYILVSPNPEALEMVRSADTFFADEVSAEEFLAISQADVAAYGNMQVSAPIISGLFQNLADMSSMFLPMGGMQPGLMSASLANIEEQLAQMESISVRYEFTDTGLKFAESVVFVEDSQIGQYYASQSPAGGSLVGMLPDLPYMAAFGARWQMSEEMKAYSVETLSNMLNCPAVVDKFGQDVIDDMLSLSEEMYGNVSEMQFVVGGAPEGSGTIAAALVFRTDDAAGAMAKLPDRAALAETAINALIESFDSGEAGVTISVVQGAEMVGGVSVDHVAIHHPELDEADEDELQQAEAVLGMREIKFLVAAPDANTLIVTFGGGSAMMAETIRTAQSGGTIGSAEGVAEVLTELPSDPYVVGLVSLGNIGKVGAATELAVDPDKGYLAWPLADMENAKPIAMAAGIDGATLTVVAFAPNDVIADIVSAVMAAQEASYQRMMEQMQNGRSAPPGWEEDAGPVEGEDEGF